jgi:hypothetical protein
MNPAGVQDKTAVEAAMNAVLIYDDFIVAARMNGELKTDEC